MGPIRVISLARHAQRRAEFLRRNSHLPCTFFDAVDGRTLTADQIALSGLFTAEVAVTYNAHSYGCALSHWHLWKEAAVSPGPVTIAEDDAVFRHDFQAASRGILDKLPADWDMVLWGWNFDLALAVRPMGGVSPVAMVFNQDQLRRSLDVFQTLRTPVQALKLDSAFGLPAYTLSPGGAAKLLKRCFPQRQLAVIAPLFNHVVANIGVDVSTNAVYPDTECFACFPPLAVTPNVRGDAVT